MSNDTLSFSTIFPVCRLVLDDLLIPIEYTELTRLALKRLNVSISEVDFKKQKEDVREKLQKRNDLNCFYVGPPKYYYVAKDWFLGNQLALFNTGFLNPYRISGNINSGVNGAYEIVMRFPHMFKKNPNASQESRTYGGARGMVIEAHVSDWFKCKWPNLILDPENKGKWERHCNHDFKIAYHAFRKYILVDVWGPNGQGHYNKPEFKQAADIHLQCRICPKGKDVIWESVITGSMYKYHKGPLSPQLGKSPTQMIVWLNCLQHEIDYEEIRRTVCAE